MTLPNSWVLNSLYRSPNFFFLSYLPFLRFLLLLPGRFPQLYLPTLLLSSFIPIIMFRIFKRSSCPLDCFFFAATFSSERNSPIFRVLADREKKGVGIQQFANFHLVPSFHYGISCFPSEVPGVLSLSGFHLSRKYLSGWGKPGNLSEPRLLALNPSIGPSPKCARIPQWDTSKCDACPLRMLTPGLHLP